MVTLGNITYEENETMRICGKQHLILKGSTEGNALNDILSAFGIDKEECILTPGDLIFLCSNVMNMGKVLGIREERAKRYNGKKNND